jgi:hypothetical protein
MSADTYAADDASSPIETRPIAESVHLVAGVPRAVASSRAASLKEQ